MEAAELWKGCTIPRREAVGKESNGKAAPYPGEKRWARRAMERLRHTQVAGTKEEAMEEGKHFDSG